MHTTASAAVHILQHIDHTPAASIPLKQAGGLVLSEDVVSPLAIPPWDNSAMDGYAARSQDLGSAPVQLDVVEEIAAGASGAAPIEQGTCARIFTGAPIPQGADTVIRQEDTTPLPDRRVRVDDLRDVRRNVRRRGEDIEEGSTVLESGTVLGAAHLGVLASLGRDTAPVYRRPRIGILASGDEIVDLDRKDEILAGRKIATSNSYTLYQLIRDAGGEPVNLGIARDDPADVRVRFEAGGDTDLIVTTAGISVGDHDYLHQVLDELRIKENIWRIRMRPGAPVGFGLVEALNDIPWIGLPGNPVSTMVTFELLVRPAIRKLMGHAEPYRRTIPVICGEPVKLGPPLQHFLRTRLDRSTTPPTVLLTGRQGSGILTSMARAHALMIVPEDVQEVRQGQTMRAIVLDDPVHLADCPW